VRKKEERRRQLLSEGIGITDVRILERKKEQYGHIKWRERWLEKGDHGREKGTKETAKGGPTLQQGIRRVRSRRANPDIRKKKKKNGGVREKKCEGGGKRKKKNIKNKLLRGKNGQDLPSDFLPNKAGGHVFRNEGCRKEGKKEGLFVF